MYLQPLSLVAYQNQLEKTDRVGPESGKCFFAGWHGVDGLQRGHGAPSHLKALHGSSSIHMTSILFWGKVLKKVVSYFTDTFVNSLAHSVK